MKIKSLILALFALMSVTIVYAYDFEVNGIYYNIEKDGAWVTNYKFKNYKYIPGYAGAVVIPRSVTNPLDGKTYNVTGIDVFAFRECTELTSVTLPKSIAAIGDGPFFGCVNLKTIKVKRGNKVFNSRRRCRAIIETQTQTLVAGCPKTRIHKKVKSIGDFAFSGLSCLTTVVIPENIKLIGDFAYFQCDSLSSITIPEHVTEIGEYAFSGCKALNTLNIKTPVPPLCGKAAFKEVDKVSCQVNVPEGSEENYRKSNKWSDFKNIQKQANYAQK